MWQKKWDDNSQARHLYCINKTVNFTISAPKMTRHNDILFYRLRTGYIKLNSYLNKIGFVESNLCDTCNQEETVKHYIQHCKKYNIYRQNLIEKLLKLGVNDLSLTTILSGKNFQPVVEYVNHTDRF